MKTKLLVVVVASLVLMGSAAAVLSSQASALSIESTKPLTSPLTSFAQTTTYDKNFKPARIDCKPTNGEQLTKDNCGIIKYVVVLTNIISGLVGITLVVMITYAGVEYSTAANDPQRVANAKGRIRKAILALIVYIFMIAFLQWLVPGGVF